jgi:short-subunit dehydrogenase
MTSRMHVLITGATGGIGEALARQMAGLGCDLTLVARDATRLAALADDLRATGRGIAEIAIPLGRDTDYTALASRIVEVGGPVDILINNAAVNWFGHFATMPDADIDAVIDTNIAAPIHMCRAVLPFMQQAGQGTIVNIGSVFGSIAFAGFPVYSASKFALRGFSQGLRRELRGSHIDVLYVAPRYTRTSFNTGPVDRMARATGMAMDAPQSVAARIVTAIRKKRSETTIGFPERFFAKLNALLPGLVDLGLMRANREILSFAPKKPGCLTFTKENVS